MRKIPQTDIAVIDSIARYGRTHKLEIMMRYKFSSAITPGLA